jgi:phytoene dehydrogenase-like protein
VGLLHPLVIEELELPRRGYRWTPAMGGYFVPFDDGTSLQLWDDEAKADEELKRFSPKDVEGRHAMHRLMHRCVGRDSSAGRSGRGIGRAPTRDQLEERLGHDPDAIGLLFEWSMAELMERYLTDERMQIAYMGQGVVGTFASPYDSALHPSTSITIAQARWWRTGRMGVCHRWNGDGLISHS